MSRPRILIVEDDVSVQQPLRAVLAQYGAEVMTANDGAEGLRLARAWLPDLLLLDVMMPHVDGWTMLQQLRSQPEFALTPAIFLTALPLQNTMVESFKLGGVDYLPKPFRFEDVIQKVSAALRRRDEIEAVLRARVAASAVPTPQAGLRGSLDQVGLASLLSVMEYEKKTGLLTLTRTQPATVGVIVLRNGRAVRADVPGQFPLTGAHAVFEMLSWDAGEAEFQAQPVDGPDVINTSTTHLLMEGARILDEARRASGG
jgi:DNA-binding response OmpR family regulator